MHSPAFRTPFSTFTVTDFEPPEPDILGALPTNWDIDMNLSPAITLESLDTSTLLTLTSELVVLVMLSLNIAKD